MSLLIIIIPSLPSVMHGLNQECATHIVVKISVSGFDIDQVVSMWLPKNVIMTIYSNFK